MNGNWKSNYIGTRKSICELKDMDDKRCEPHIGSFISMEIDVTINETMEIQI